MTPSSTHRRRWALRLGAVALVAAGVWTLGAALIAPAKAALGFYLLDRAFEARRAADDAERRDGALWRPWSSADLAPIGRLSFPRLGESRIILDSASGEALAWGVGHIRGAAPLGAPGMTAVAGHRDGGFTLLGELSEGDIVEITPLAGAPIRYEVTRRQIADARYDGIEIRHYGPDDLVMATCWPIEALASGPERLLVYARRLEEER